MATTSDFRNGMVLEIDGNLHQIVYFQHVKPGKGPAFVRSKLKSVLTGAVVEKTWTAGGRVSEVRLERRPVQYSYKDDQHYHFMDMESYEDSPLNAEVIGADQLKYLKEETECSGLIHNDAVIMIELPNFVELKIVETDPGVRGDTASGGTKPAKLETGAVVQVPLFIEQGDVVRVDRREDKYMTRV